ncbi:type 4a pilus biogenesis protein PilO [Deinococcus lacus]|uniref:Type 4a pilus biogenesis protein PilO n=1 Tax=Deinococcus lacus TaxID=392561 RepID=A0ABW1YB72_9DEIO
MKDNKLEPRILFFIVLALCLGTLLLWYTFRYKSRLEEINALKAEIETTQATLDTYKSASAQLPELRKTVAQLEVERAAFVRALPEKSEMGALVEEMRRNAAASGVTINSLVASANGTASGNTSTVLPGGVQPIRIDMENTGTFAAMFRTLRALETMNRFTTIDGLTMALPEATSTDPALTNSLTMTVYTYDPALAGAVPAEGTAGAAPANSPVGAAASAVAPGAANAAAAQNAAAAEATTPPAGAPAPAASGGTVQ